MTGPRVALVTGASSGIGREAAVALAAQGFRVIGLGRDADRSAAARAAIDAAGGPPCTFLRADLSLLSEAARAAREVATLTDRIDVLLANAGGVTAERVVTAEGNELAFAANHLGPTLLTLRLLPLVRAAAAATGASRIVVTSSAAHERAPGFDWADPQMLGAWASVPAYANAKLANLLFARALATRVADEGIVVNAMHPGIVGTNFFSNGDADMRAYADAATLASPAEGADTLVWLATAAEAGAATGGYFHQRRAIAGSDASRDPALAERLWTETERIIAAAGV